MRVGQTFASRTYARLAALTADIHAGLIGAQSLQKPAQVQAPHPQNKVVNSCASATLAILALAAALFIGNFGLFLAVVVAILGILFVVGAGWPSHFIRSAPAGTDSGGHHHLTRAVKLVRLTSSAVSERKLPKINMASSCTLF
jgi:hypothetical protein